MTTFYRSLPAKLAALSAVVLMTAALAGCKGKPDAQAGQALMSLSLPNGATVNSVAYTISGNGITPITGTVDVSAVGSKVSFVVSGIPQGNAYLVKLSAISTDGATTCGGQANFNIIAKQTTSVTVMLKLA